MAVRSEDGRKLSPEGWGQHWKAFTKLKRETGLFEEICTLVEDAVEEFVAENPWVELKSRVLCAGVLKSMGRGPTA